MINSNQRAKIQLYTQFCVIADDGSKKAIQTLVHETYWARPFVILLSEISEIIHSMQNNLTRPVKVPE